VTVLTTLSVPLILASQSPRRRALLEQVQANFRVQVNPADEQLKEPRPPYDTARTLADRKATPVAQEHPEALVLAADTIVVHEDDLLEKPATPAEARRMLRRLSDNTHAVYTGIALHHRATGRAVTAGKETRVHFAALTDAEINAYVATESPMDKAGAYGIQDHTGPLFVQNLEGDYYNVVGLPLRRLYEVLRSDFSDLLTPPTSSP
jgi:septum formation protein